MRKHWAAGLMEVVIGAVGLFVEERFAVPGDILWGGVALVAVGGLVALYSPEIITWLRKIRAISMLWWIVIVGVVLNWVVYLPDTLDQLRRWPAMFEQVPVEWVHIIRIWSSSYLGDHHHPVGYRGGNELAVAADRLYGEDPQSICRSGKVPFQRARIRSHAASCSVLEASAQQD